MSIKSAILLTGTHSSDNVPVMIRNNRERGIEIFGVPQGFTRQHHIVRQESGLAVHSMYPHGSAGRQAAKEALKGLPKGKYEVHFLRYSDQYFQHDGRLPVTHQADKRPNFYIERQDNVGHTDYDFLNEFSDWQTDLTERVLVEAQKHPKLSVRRDFLNGRMQVTEDLGGGNKRDIFLSNYDKSRLSLLFGERPVGNADLAIVVSEEHRGQTVSDRTHKREKTMIAVRGLDQKRPLLEVLRNGLDLDVEQILATIETGLSLFELFHLLEGEFRTGFPGNIKDETASRPTLYGNRRDNPIDPKFIRFKLLLGVKQYSLG